MDSPRTVNDGKGFKEKIKNDKKTENKYKNYKNIRNGNKMNDIPIRDVHGNNNSDEDLEDERKKHKTDGFVGSQYEDIWQDDDDDDDDDTDSNDIKIDEDESQVISGNNPFAKQRILKSKYKNMYPE